METAGTVAPAAAIVKRPRQAISIRFTSPRMKM